MAVPIALGLGVAVGKVKKEMRNDLWRSVPGKLMRRNRFEKLTTYLEKLEDLLDGLRQIESDVPNLMFNDLGDLEYVEWAVVLRDAAVKCDTLSKER